MKGLPIRAASTVAVPLATMLARACCNTARASCTTRMVESFGQRVHLRLLQGRGYRQQVFVLRDPVIERCFQHGRQVGLQLPGSASRQQANPEFWTDPGYFREQRPRG